MSSNRSKIIPRTNQEGFVSIMVTVVIMVIIGLIVISFAKLIRREQQQALDRQLSTQAFYAAETGVNDAVDAIKSGLLAAGKTDCSPIPKASGTYNNQLSSNVSYTCVTVNRTPGDLDFSSGIDSKSKVVPVISSDGVTPITTLNLSWQNVDGTKTNFGCPTAGTFVADTSWNCDPGLLRVDLVPTSGSVSRDNLIANTMTAFLFPKAGVGGSIDYSVSHGVGGGGVSQSGVVQSAGCSSPAAGSKYHCKLSITGLNSVSYYVRLRSIYKTSSVNITALSGVNPLSLTGAQIAIDSTGKASDVLRRIEVRVPVDTINGPLPDFALLSADSICKRFLSTPTTSYVDPAYSSEPTCSLN